MGWLTVIADLASRIPVERVLFPPRDNVKALEELAATMTSPVAENKAPPEQKVTPTITQEPETASIEEAVATACVPCAVGHFSTSAGVINEALRFKREGITSNEILDRIAKALEEQNTLERVDLTEEKIQSSPPWERAIAEEALTQSRSLRHRLENLSSIEQLEQVGADSERVYKQLFREWFKNRFAHLGPDKAQRIADERVLKSREE